MATAWQLHGQCMATAWHCMGNAWQLHGQCMTTADRLKANGFKTFPPSLTRLDETKPMVLRRLVESHAFRLQKNQWLM